MTQTDKEKIKNTVRIIDRYLEGFKEQRRKHNALDSSEYNYEYGKAVNSIIMELQTIRDELIPEEKPKKS